MLHVPVALIDATVEVPRPARPGDAGLDLRARTGAVLAPAGGRALIPTGLLVAIPEGHAGYVLPRSGLALHHGVTCLNAPGLIDAGYRGEVGVVLVNLDPTEAFEVEVGDRIAQLVIAPVPEVVLEVVSVEALGETDRGAGGFGHSGAR